MVRLLHRAQNGRTDPELFAGLCPACRYCGLLEASVAAHDRARRLDPKILTGVAHTHFVLGAYQRVLESDPAQTPYISVLSLAAISVFQRILARAETHYRAAVSGFHEADGHNVLGVTVAPVG